MTENADKESLIISHKIEYDEKYYNNLKKLHKNTAKMISDIRWKFVEDIEFSKVLDYGCGCGELTKYSPKKHLIIESYDIGTINGSPYPQTGILSSSYDLVFMNDVIEHVDWKNFPDTKMEEVFLKTIYLYITVPILPDGENLENWRHYKPGEHLTYFSHQSLIDFFKERNFKKIKDGYIECPPRQNVWSVLFKRV